MLRRFLIFWLLLVGVLFGKESGEKWEVPEVDAENLSKWQEFIFPKGDELAWRQIRWHRELEFAAEEARELGRPVLLWAMNGHPAGET
ncbi:MAG: hypothetical protein ACSHYB_14725 [Roseibacillus sp.]